MVYACTGVASGRASAVLAATGQATEIGQIPGMLQQAHPAPTPLQRQLAELGRTLVAACLGIVAVVFVLELCAADGCWTCSSSR
jgi:Ca2+-transporting ATPase